MRATGERRHSPWTERTDPHGFAPVDADEEPAGAAIPRQRGERPAHDPWDPEYRAADRSVAVDRDGYPARRARRADEPRRRAARGATDTAARARVADPGPSPDPGLLCGTDPADAYLHPEEAPPSRTRLRRPDGPDRAARRPDRPDRPIRTDAASRPDRARRPDPRGTRSAMIPAPGPRLRTIAIPAAVGSLVAVGIGVWARAHDPSGVAVNLAGFSSGPAVKTWLATLALVLALGQGWTGMVLHGRVGSGPTALTATVHRWSGRLAVLVTLPVAVQCLFALGWSGATTRTLLHSLLGCVFYGAFVTKMLLLNRRGVPGWVVAVCGGLLLAVLSGIWLTSAAWFFGTHGLTF